MRVTRGRVLKSLVGHQRAIFGLLLAISIPAWSSLAPTQVNTSLSASPISAEAGTATNCFFYSIIVATIPYPIFPFGAGPRPGILDLIPHYANHQNNSFYSNLHSTATRCPLNVLGAPWKNLPDRRSSIVANTGADKTASIFSDRRIANVADRFHKAARELL